MAGRITRVGEARGVAFERDTIGAVSRDILIMRVPEGTRSFDSLPETFEHDLGDRSAVREIISSSSARIRFHDQRWAELRDSAYRIDVDVGERERCRSVMLHIEGDVAASIPSIRHLCTGRPWAALDLAEVDFIDLDSPELTADSTSPTRTSHSPPLLPNQHWSVMVTAPLG